jgi:outer membrane protein with beta-barrel domain
VISVRCLLVLVVSAISTLAQGLEIGVKVGVPFASYFDTGGTYNSATRRYTIGPTAELRFGRGMALEVDALYERIGYTGQTAFQRRPFDGVITTTTFDVTGNSWDFPLLLKYRAGGRIGVYIAAGGVIRDFVSAHERGVTTVQDLIAGTTVSTPIHSSEPFDLRKRVYPGITLAGGLEFGTGHLRFSPELRYTHWTSNIGSSQLRLGSDQVEFLLGITY